MKTLFCTLLSCAAFTSMSASAAAEWAVVGGKIDIRFGDRFSPVVFTDINGIYGQAGRRLKLIDPTVELKSGDAGSFSFVNGDTYPDDDDVRYDWSLHLNTRLSYSLVDATSGDLVTKETNDFSLNGEGFKYLSKSDDGEFSGDLPAISFGGGSSGVIDSFGAWRYSATVTAAETAPGVTTLTLDSYPAEYDVTLRPEFGGGRYLAGYSGEVQISPVPEPETYALLALGLGAVGLARRRKALRH